MKVNRNNNKDNRQEARDYQLMSSRFHRLVVFCLASLTKRYRKKKMESVRKEKERLTPVRIEDNNKEKE